MNSSIANAELRQLMTEAWAVRATERWGLRKLWSLAVEAFGPRLCGSATKGAECASEAARSLTKDAERAAELRFGLF